MRVPGPLDATVRTGLKTLAVLPRVIEKSSASSALGHERQSFNQDGEKATPRLQVELVCQNEARTFDPFWDAPRLMSTFVAQVMGQAMPERRGTSVSAQTAYGSVRCPRKALLLDCKS
jgi:hypothetical protein